MSIHAFPSSLLNVDSSLCNISLSTMENSGRSLHFFHHRWPAANTKLSDAWAVMTILFIPVDERAYKWPADFEANGNLKDT
ncbi:hypothetical protein BDV35DRAFT_367417 [Aspergillus flavus]|uniref:Uncharacterized protein n=1 Tax=Aspergillus flavus TaxID=5059 RepID=A0A5N6GI45_ASPFL|nr:hypothetical protein BDV35DRAFT_367417 [Aspergillus flavus]